MHSCCAVDAIDGEGVIKVLPLLRLKRMDGFFDRWPVGYVLARPGVCWKFRFSLHRWQASGGEILQRLFTFAYSCI